MEKIWLNSYPNNIPHEINPDKYPSVVDLMLKSCETFGQKKAFVNFDSALTYQEVESLSKAFATYLKKVLGVQRGDRIALMLPNILQYPIAMLGALRAGMTVVNVNPLYTPHELVHILSDAKPKVVVVLENFAHTVKEALPGTSGIEKVIVTKMGDLLGRFKGTLANIIVKYVKRLVPAYKINRAIPFTQVIEARDPAYNERLLTGDDIAFLQYTGGTTGHPKAAILTHRNMVANILQATSWMKHIDLTNDEIIITAIPLYHIFSLTANLFSFFSFGALNVLITNPRDMKSFVSELKKYRFTAITGVNTLFNALLNNPEFTHCDFSKLHVSLAGGMALQESVAQRWQQVTGKTLVEAYGLTETSPAVCINPLDLPKYNGSIGLPVSSTDVAILDEQGKPLPTGEVGELAVKGPQVMRAYWQQPEESRTAFTEDKWFLTGDMGRMDEHGFVYIVDRKKDMIVVSGFNVYPNEVEGVIAKMDDVMEVAVVGVPNSQMGEMVKAFIVKRHHSLTKETVLAFCERELTKYKIPKSIEFVNELPKTTVGKISRKALREQSAATS